MEKSKKEGRYNRIFKQLDALMPKSENNESRMASIIAVLHNKMDYFFWTGFYFLNNDKLQVKMYQGPVACMELKKNTGACWHAINTKQPLILKDVNDLEDHIACDSRSKSEIVIPLFDKNKNVYCVLDVDSDKLNSFDETDKNNLINILSLIDKVY